MWRWICHSCTGPVWRLRSKLESFQCNQFVCSQVFLRAWVAVDLPKLYNPVTNLLGPAAAPPQFERARKAQEVRRPSCDRMSKRRKQKVYTAMLDHQPAGAGGGAASIRARPQGAGGVPSIAFLVPLSTRRPVTSMLGPSLRNRRLRASARRRRCGPSFKRLPRQWPRDCHMDASWVSDVIS